MRAIRFHGPGDLRLDDVPEPTSGAVIAVEACGVCGSDLHFVDGSARTASTPITLGHEIAGKVVSDPSGQFPAGAAVVVAVGRFCGSCPQCAAGRHNLCQRAEIVGIDFDGGLAERVSVHPDMLLSRPPGLSPEVAATAVDAGSTAWHAVRRVGQVAEGDTVLVIGVGGLGGYGVQLARLAGAAVIAADTDGEALERARALGADDVVHVEEGVSVGRAVKLLTDGGVDAAIEFVGRAATVDAAVKSLRPGGRAVVAGVGMEPITTLPPVLWSNNEYRLEGAYGSLPGDTETVLELLADGMLEAPPLERVHLDRAAEAITARAEVGTVGGGGRLIVDLG